MDIQYNQDQKKFQVYLKIDIEEKKQELKEKVQKLFKEKSENLKIEFQRLHKQFQQTKFYHDWISDLEDAKGRLKNYRDEVKSNISNQIQTSVTEVTESEQISNLQQKMQSINSVIKEKYKIIKEKLSQATKYIEDTKYGGIAVDKIKQLDETLSVALDNSIDQIQHESKFKYYQEIAKFHEKSEQFVQQIKQEDILKVEKMSNEKNKFENTNRAKRWKDHGNIIKDYDNPQEQGGTKRLLEMNWDHLKNNWEGMKNNIIEENSKILEQKTKKKFKEQSWEERADTIADLFMKNRDIFNENGQKSKQQFNQNIGKQQSLFSSSAAGINSNTNFFNTGFNESLFAQQFTLKF